MELQTTKHQLLLEEWKDRVHECRNSKKTIKAWCAEQGVKEQTYYRWQKLVWEAGMQSVSLTHAAEQPVTFAEYQPCSPKADPSGRVVVYLPCGKVEIQKGADRETIQNALQALKSLC